MKTRKIQRRSRKAKKSRRQQRKRRSFFRQRGGVNLPVPEGSVVAVDLDPKDDYSVPILVRKSVYENEILEN